MYPKPIQDLAGWNIKYIGTGYTSIIVSADDTVIAWGASPCYGELGLGDMQKTSTTPKEVRFWWSSIGVGSDWISGHLKFNYMCWCFLGDETVGCKSFGSLHGHLLYSSDSAKRHSGAKGEVGSSQRIQTIIVVTTLELCSNNSILTFLFFVRPERFRFPIIGENQIIKNKFLCVQLFSGIKYPKHVFVVKWYKCNCRSSSLQCI